MTTTESPSSATVPTSEELLSRLRQLRPLLAKNSAQSEEERRVVEESIQALTEAGVVKAAQPQRYGGYQTSMRTSGVRIQTPRSLGCSRRPRRP